MCTNTFYHNYLPSEGPAGVEPTGLTVMFASAKLVDGDCATGVFPVKWEKEEEIDQF